MSKPAARVGDLHTCPMATPGTPPVPHVGGPVTGPGIPTVLIGGLPAAVLGDMCVCTGPPDTVVLGSTGVFIGGKPAARMGDSTAHGGIITAGCPTVLIGETSAVSAAGTPMINVDVVINAIDQLEGVEKSTLTKMKVIAGQIATMKQAAETGKALAHNPQSCSDCSDAELA